MQGKYQHCNEIQYVYGVQDDLVNPSNHQMQELKQYHDAEEKDSNYQWVKKFISEK